MKMDAAKKQSQLKQRPNLGAFNKRLWVLRRPQQTESKQAPKYRLPAKAHHISIVWKSELSSSFFFIFPTQTVAERQQKLKGKTVN